MATVTINNLTASPIYLSDIYTNVPANGSITIPGGTTAQGGSPGTTNALDQGRYPGQLLNMDLLMNQVAAGKMSFQVTYTAAEIAAGMGSPNMPLNVVGPLTTGTTAATQGSPSLATTSMIHMPFTSVNGDVAIYAAGSLPAQMRVLDAVLYVSTVQVGSSVSVYTQAAAAGTDIAGFSGATAGRVVPTTGSLGTTGATVDVSPASNVGLFLHSATAGVVGEIVLTVQYGA